jgi:type IV pilus assembly protein PilV
MNRTTLRRRATLGRQAGVMLLEALIALLIFSIGILAIVGMQATAVQDLGESKYRTDAAFLANQIVADMWSNSAQLGSYAFAGSGAPPAQLAGWVATVRSRLPGADAYPPIISVAPDNTVTVTVRWQQARDKARGAAPHRYTAIAYVSCCE